MNKNGWCPHVNPPCQECLDKGMDAILKTCQDAWQRLRAGSFADQEGVASGRYPNAVVCEISKGVLWANAELTALRSRCERLEKVARAARGTILVYDMDQVEFMLLPDPMGMIRAALDAEKEGK